MKIHVKRTPLAFLPRHQRAQWCWVTVVSVRAGTFVIFEEPEGWPGSSLTNGIEYAIAAYHFWADLMDWPEPQDLRYVEYSDDGESSWCFVSLTDPHDRPNWQPVPDEWAWSFLDAINGEERVWLSHGSK